MVAVCVFPTASVAVTVAVPVDAGAVKMAVVPGVVMLPIELVQVYGETPPDAVRV